uniref:Uncharacterized protein n=1 Tax=Polysiphonia sertularioides TaxID=945028 RepID=A0A1Z1M9I6_9FLOR|nr:hypothetical protein [Polysiphonia sertularioides]ARW62404.1 hypothetical protein [Polysiphonia sertularioides]
MIKYWPTKPSIYLNNSIVDLFIETEKKFVSVKYNKSNRYIYLDLLNIISRNKLFKYIIHDFKKLILDLIELDLKFEEINEITTKVRAIFIKKTSRKFLSNSQKFSAQWNSKIEFNNDSRDLVEHLLTYLIFGSSLVDRKTFVFQPSCTPYNHVKMLLENFIIQTANSIIQDIIYNLSNSPNISKFLQNHNICNKLYISNRSIILFLNNIKWQNFLQSNIYEIKSLYGERQQVWILSSKGIITKYIYLSNLEEIKTLNYIKAIFVIWLELKDVLIPKVEKLILQMIKYFLYLLLNLLNNLFLIIIKILVFYLSK